MSVGSLVDKALKELRDEFPEVAWTTSIITLFISPITVIGNGLVLASILRDPFKNIRSSPSSNLIFSLALTDFLMGIVTDPLAAVWHIYTASTNAQPYSSNIINVSAIFLVGVSLYSLVALSVDRRIAITTPLQYAYRVTKKKIRIAIACIWCYFVLTGIMWTVFQSYKLLLDIIISTHMAIAAIILAVLNVAVIRSVRTQAFNIKETVDSENLVVIQNAFNREKAVTQTIVLMVIAFEICFWPHIIILAIRYRMLELTDLQDFKTFLWMYYISKSLVFANSLINPFLYAWRLQKYRKAFRYIIFQLKNNIFPPEVQTKSKRSRQLSTVEDNHIKPVSVSLPPNEHHMHHLQTIKTTRQPVLRSPVYNQIAVQECSCGKEARQPSIVNTWL